MNILLALLLGSIALYLARRAWVHLARAYDDVFNSTIHNPYNPNDDNDADYYGDIPNPPSPVDRRHD